MDCRTALLTVLDQVDYTNGACGLTEMVGACLPKEVISMARKAIAEENLKVDRTDELVRCLENAIKFVYHYYGDDKEALADMETSTWRTIVKDLQRA